MSINVNADGSVTLVEGSTDIGGTRASIAMQAAEVLGLKAEEVRPIVADTASVGYNDVTGAVVPPSPPGMPPSRRRRMSRQMIERAARIWKVEPPEVTFADGVFHHNNAGDQRLTFKEVAAQLGRTGAVTGRATVAPRGVGGRLPRTSSIYRSTSRPARSRSCAIPRCRMSGKAIHPSYVEGQMQGGAVQGIGWASTRSISITTLGPWPMPASSITGCPPA